MSDKKISSGELLGNLGFLGCFLPLCLIFMFFYFLWYQLGIGGVIVSIIAAILLYYMFFDNDIEEKETDTSIEDEEDKNPYEDRTINHSSDM
jgi:hypothetical protein